MAHDTHFNLPHIPAVRGLVLALVITLAFVVVEAAAGVLGNSLALLSDAAHNLTDVLTLGLTWYALRLTIQPANASKTYGYHRAGILVALLNSLTLAFVAVWIFYEAIERLRNPQPVAAGLMVLVAALAFAVNLGTALLIRGDSHEDLGMKSAYLHLLSDAISTAGALVAGVLIFFTGADWIDPFVSVLIGGLILWNAWKVLREAINILLESTPSDISIEGLVGDLQTIPGVEGVHDLHVWSLDQRLRALSAHLVLGDITVGQAGEIQQKVNSVLKEKYRIAHTTLQVECIRCSDDDLYCELCEPETQQHG